MDSENIKKLSREYQRFKIVDEIVSIESNPMYVIAVEKMLMLMANIIDSDRDDEVFVNADNNHYVYNPVKLLINYGISHKNIGALLNFIKGKIRTFINKKKFKKPIKFGNKKNFFYCDDFKKKNRKQTI